MGSWVYRRRRRRRRRIRKRKRIRKMKREKEETEERRMKMRRRMEMWRRRMKMWMKWGWRLERLKWVCKMKRIKGFVWEREGCARWNMRSLEPYLSYPYVVLF